MKKILTIIFCSVLYFQSDAQLMQSSIGIGSQANRIKIYLKSDVSQNPSSISTLQFNVGVVAAGLTTAPTLTVLSSAFSGVTWQQNAPYLEGGYWNYNIFTPTSPLTPIFTANTEFEAMELEFNDGVPNMATVGLVTLPDGGLITTNGLFLSTGTVTSNGMSNLYFARSGVTVDNKNSYDPNSIIPGTQISTAMISNVSLPVKFLGFDVIKKDKNALLTWQIENESSLTDRYDIERSANGVHFSKIQGVAAKNNGSSNNVYTFTDADLGNIKSSGVVYYRIKQTDKDGRYTLTNIKNLRLDTKGISINVYPNPIKNIATLSFDLVKDADVMVTINDGAGKQVQSIPMQLFKGLNIKTINMSSFAAGSYMLSINAGTEIKNIALVKVN